MRHSVLVLVMTLLAAVASAVSLPAIAQSAARKAIPAPADLTIAGRPARCDGARILLDRSLPNLGAAEPGAGLLILNPSLLRKMPETVQLFVFHHECGHHHVGGNELAADCWAAGRGTRDGWLDTKGLGEVCASFGDMPESDTHPSGRRRCANISRCVATTAAGLAREKARASEIATAASSPALPKAHPALVPEPRLLWSSRLAAPTR